MQINSELMRTLLVSLILAIGCSSNDSEPVDQQASPKAGTMSNNAETQNDMGGDNAGPFAPSFGWDDGLELDVMCEAAATHSAPGGRYSPATRISQLSMPKNVNDARTAGCISVGSNMGTGLSTLFALLVGDLNSFVQRNDQGEYELLLLAHITDWAAGEAASNHKLQLFFGELKNDTFWIDLDSFNEKDDTKGVPLEFDAMIDECNITTKTGMFPLDITTANRLPIKLNLTSTTIRGQVAGDDTGFALIDTTISGYLSADDVTNLVNGMKTACAGQDAPDVCATADPIIGVDDAVEKVVNLMKGYDAKLENDTPVECDKKIEGACNAVSVCIAIGSESVSIEGLSAD